MRRGKNDAFGAFSSRLPNVVLQVSGDRGDDDAGVDRHEIDACQRQPHPGIDDDALVENAIEHVDEAVRTGGTLDRHMVYFSARGTSIVAAAQSLKEFLLSGAPNSASPRPLG